MGAIVNDLFKKRSQLAQKLASMTTDDVLKMRTGYAGKSQQWQYGFDLACREKQAEIDAIKAERDALLAALEWQPIESAPTNQRVLIIDEFLEHQAVASRKIGGHWKTHSNTPEGVWRPKFWQPLPPPPEAKARGDL